MSANAAAKKQKPLKRHPSKLKKMSAYMILTLILISIVAVLFAFPLYWIITGSFKTGAAINATTPEWWPSQWVLTNYQKLFSGKSAPLWQLAVPFGSKFSANGEPIYFSVGPTAPAAIRWMINTVFMAVMSMILTCITAAMAGYALAKKRFVGRKLLFTLIVCAMALPKQVILIPLLREMSSLSSVRASPLRCWKRPASTVQARPRPSSTSCCPWSSRASVHWPSSPSSTAGTTTSCS